MQVAALADALAGSRGPDGTISLHLLDSRLSSAGLDELIRAVAALPGRPDSQDELVSDGPQHVWL